MSNHKMKQITHINKPKLIKKLTHGEQSKQTDHTIIATYIS